MVRYYGSIVAAAAVVAAGLAATQTDLLDRLRGDRPAAQEQAAPVAEATAAKPATAPAARRAGSRRRPAPAAPPEALTHLRTQIAELAERVAAREAELAELEASLAARDASLAEASAALAERDAELERLRAELEAMRERYAFDIQLAAMKSGEPAPGLPSALAAPTDPAMAADAFLAAAKAPEPREQPLTSVQFEVGSAALTPGGQIHVAAAAVMLGDMTLERVRVLGHTDRTGGLDLNRALAAARARAVAELLVASGVAAELVEAEGMGWQNLPIPTDDGVAEPLNRSVAIVAVALPTS